MSTDQVLSTVKPTAKPQVKPILDLTKGTVYIMEFDLEIAATTRADQLPDYVEIAMPHKTTEHCFIAGMALDSAGILFVVRAWFYRNLIYQVQIMRSANLESSTQLLPFMTQADLIESQKWYEIWLHQQTGRIAPCEFAWGNIEGFYDLRVSSSGLNINYLANSPYRQYTNKRELANKKRGLLGFLDRKK